MAIDFDRARKESIVPVMVQARCGFVVIVWKG